MTPEVRRILKELYQQPEVQDAVNVVEPIPEPVKTYVLEAEYSGVPLEIPATDENSFADENGKKAFTLTAILNIKDLKSWQWIVSKRDSDNREYELAFYKGMLVWTEYDQRGNAIGRGLPLSEIPKEPFLLHIDSDETSTTDGILFWVNGRPVETKHLFESSIDGIAKTSASVFIGDSGFKAAGTYLFSGTAKIKLELGITEPQQKLNEYKRIFNIEDVFLNPAEDGNFYPVVQPSTDVDLTEPLNAFINSVPNAGQVYFADMKYWIERSLLDGRNKRGSIDNYMRRDMTFVGGTFLTKAPATGFREAYSKRSNWKGQFCLNMTHIRQGNEGANTIDKALLGLPDYRPDWWGLTRELAGHIRGLPEYEPHWEFEHGFAYWFSNGLTFKECYAYGLFGDGFSFWRCDNVKLINCHVDMIGRQGFGFSNGCNNLLLDGCTSGIGMARTWCDLEPQSGGAINNAEIRNCFIRGGHLAAGGAGYVNNLWVHDNPSIGRLLIHGGLSFPRHELVIEDNGEIDRVEVSSYTNVKINRNKGHIKWDNGETIFKLGYVRGRIEICDNEFQGQVTFDLTNIHPDAEVIIHGNNPEPIVNLHRESRESLEARIAEGYPI